MHSEVRAGIDAGRPDGAGTALTAAIVAGNEVLRRGIEVVLGAVPEIGTIRGCAGPGELAALLQLERVDVVVATAADVAWLERVHPTLVEMATTVLVVVDAGSLESLPSYASPLRHGYLWQQDLSSARLRDALHRCRSGEVPMPADLARALFARADSPTQRHPRPVHLTSREREALALLVDGLSNKQIAKALSISSHGAKRLVTSIMLKLDSPNRTLAAVTAVRSGLVGED